MIHTIHVFLTVTLLYCSFQDSEVFSTICVTYLIDIAEYLGEGCAESA